jgi:DNA-binding CsgD family transcriptional regulator/GAF domain-containing protein
MTVEFARPSTTMPKRDSADHLRNQTEQALRRVEEALGGQRLPKAHAEDHRYAAAIEASLTALSEAGGQRTASLVSELDLLDARWQDRLLRRRLRAVEGALALESALPPMANVTTVCDLAAEVLVSALGFERVMVFAVRDSRLAIVATRFRDSPRWAAHCHAFAGAHPIELADGRMEQEVLRRGTGAYAWNAMRDPRTAHAITTETRTESYLSVPIIVGGRLLGVVNADRHFSRRPVGEGDVDTAITFAGALGTAWARAGIVDELQDLNARIGAAVTADGGRDRHSSPPYYDRSPEARTATDACHSTSTRGASAVHPRLTDREHDVLRLLATGARNGQIASALHVTEGTIKTHVTHILHKLGASTRGEAVAHYLRTAP